MPGEYVSAGLNESPSWGLTSFRATAAHGMRTTAEDILNASGCLDLSHCAI
jgi:hypothetical protein